MKNLIIFLFGAACGVGGTLLWLRKDIQKELNEIKNNQQKSAENEKKSEEVPFQMEEIVAQATVGNNIPKKKAEKVAYNTIPLVTKEESEPEDTDPGSDETDGGIFEIDADEYMHNKEYEQEHLVYYRGDRVMATEEGTIIANPFMLVGGEWETCVGNYADRTAFVRNSKLVTDYEIYVEDGTYVDEYGPIENL